MTEKWNVGSGVLRGALVPSGAGSGNVANPGKNGVSGHGSVGNGVTSTPGAGSHAAGGHGGGTGIGGGTTFSAANGESGILRRTGGHYHLHGGVGPESFDDLLVFGYSCKVFRDDERARFIDQGRHLIPWMGDNQLKIDRYDARGALHDLSPHEPPPGGYQDRLEGLSAAEQRAEQLCEEERYYSLYNNEVEEEMYQEEARKREQMLGNQVPFNYDAPLPQDGTTVATVEDRTGTSADEQDDDDPYVVPTGFEIPPDIPLPDRMKEHAVIEKTAKFIASQDAQMEILLKTKQANNPTFDFLNQAGRLFRYYRHVLLAFRTNQYPVVVEQPTEGQEGPSTNDESEQDASVAQQRPKIIVPAIKYKPSVDCAYTQLISKITGAPIPTAVPDEMPSAAEAPTSAQGLTSLNTEFDYYPEGKDAGTGTTVEVKKVSTGLAGLVQYDSDSEEEGNEERQQKQMQTSEGGKRTVELAPFQGVVPSVPIQHVIDRTATYVAKNGYSFEEALRVKNDARFVFLNHAHEYYPYYAYRVRQLMNDAGEDGPGMQHDDSSPPPAKVRTETENGTVVETTPSLGIKTVHTAAPRPVPMPVTNIQHQKLGAPVSFSLVRKTKEDGGTMKTMPGLGSDEDDEQPEQREAQKGQVCDQQADTGNELEHVDKTVSTVIEEVANAFLVEGADALEASEAPVSSQRAENEPVAAKEKQAERKKRANMFVNLIKHVDRKPEQTTCGGGSTENDGTVVEDNATATRSVIVSDNDDASIHSVHSTTPSPRKTNPRTPNAVCSSIVTTVIEDEDDDDVDDDDDDVVLVSETRPILARSRTRSRDPERSSNGTGRSSRSKKKKSKSRHRSTRGKKKAKKKSRSRTRSPSHTPSEGSPARQSRNRHRGRSTNRSRSRSSSTVSRISTRTNRHAKRRKRSKRRATRSRTVSRSRSRSRSHPRVKRSGKQHTPTKRRQRQDDRSRSRSANRKSDSDADDQRRHRKHRRRAEDRTNDGQYEYEERYPPTRGRYWDC